MNDYRAFRESFHDEPAMASNRRRNTLIAIGNGIIATAAAIFLASLIYGLL